MNVLRMNILRTLCFAIPCCLVLAACDHETTFDASSVPAYQKSLSEIKAGLSPADQRRLEMALLTLAAGMSADYTAFGMINPSKAADFEALDGVTGQLMFLDRMRPRIAGKTAAEVINRVADDLDYEISRIETQAGSADKQLKAIVIENPRFRLENKGRNVATGEFSVYNGSSIAIRQLYLTGELTTHDVKVPLVLNNLSYYFSRPLQPGVQQQAKVYLGITGDWMTKNFPTAYDPDLKLKVANVDDADGRKLLTVNVRVLDTLKHKRDVLRGS
jgi:hypothetical protein